LSKRHRAAAPANHPRFAELVQHTRFYLKKANDHEGTPAEHMVMAAMTAALDELIQADADAGDPGRLTRGQGFLRIGGTRAGARET
jgi:hypothetical protein